MRIGLIGLGRIGAFHARTLVQLPQVEELVVTDAVPDLVARVRAELDVDGARHLTADRHEIEAGELRGAGHQAVEVPGDRAVGVTRDLEAEL